MGYARLTLHGRWMAAVLACGPGAVLSHRDAAQLWGLYRSDRARIDVTVPEHVGRARWKHHGSRHGFESDRLRDADLLEAGYRSSARPIASSPAIRRALPPVWDASWGPVA